MRRPSRLFAAVLFLPLPALVSCGAPPPPSVPVVPPAPSAAPLATAAPPAATPSSVVRRTVVMMKRTSGTHVITTNADGTTRVSFHVRENGRGAQLDATLRLASDGTLTAYEAHGTHWAGQPFDEKFSLEGGHAQWKSQQEDAGTDVHAPSFYVPLAEAPEVGGMLASALLRAKGKMTLLPGGEAQMTKLGEETVTVGGKQKHLTAYAITGLDLTPTTEWMEDDGSWFGIVDEWLSVVPEGWDGAIDPLVAKQRTMDRERDLADAKRLAHQPPAAGLAFTHARVLDVEHGKWLADRTVVVVGDTIKAVGPSKTTKVPAAAETVDLGGKALLPGLWDMHAHLFRADGPLDIAAGVTTARDVGNDPDRLDDFKDRYDHGTAIGPRVVRFGFIEGRGENAASSAVTAETAAEAKAGVESFAKRGYEGIKIYNSVKPELVPIITKEAHARGMMVTGHIPVHMLANEAVRDGYDGIEHVNMLFLNFFATHDTETRTIARFTLVGDKAAEFDLGSKQAKEFFKLLHDHHTVVDPTFATFEGMFVQEPGKVMPDIDGIVQRLPVQTRRSYLVEGLPLKGKEDLYRRSWAKMVSITRALHDADVTIVAGTDALAGLMLHHELELLVDGGLTPAEALRAATIVPARAMKRDRDSGTIGVGKKADLCVVDGDPLATIADIRKVTTTVRGGVVFTSKDVFATVGVR